MNGDISVDPSIEIKLPDTALNPSVRAQIPNASPIPGNTNLVSVPNEFSVPVTATVAYAQWMRDNYAMFLLQPTFHAYQPLLDAFLAEQGM